MAGQTDEFAPPSLLQLGIGGGHEKQDLRNISWHSPWRFSARGRSLRPMAAAATAVVGTAVAVIWGGGHMGGGFGGGHMGGGFGGAHMGGGFGGAHMGGGFGGAHMGGGFGGARMGGIGGGYRGPSHGDGRCAGWADSAVVSSPTWSRRAAAWAAGRGG